MTNINAKTKICMIIGDPVTHSLSPQMHNSAYEELGIDNEFVFVATRVKLEDIGQVVSAVKVLNIRGLTCTVPHKIEIIKYLDEKNIDPVALKIGAVNTIVNNNGILNGFNTDWLGVLKPLEKLTALKDKKVAILGAGGAARAMAYAVSSAGAKFTVYNRSINRALELAEEFGGIGKSYKELSESKNADIILNATTVGMNLDETLLPKQYITDKQIVFDAVYTPFETRLLRDAREQGAVIIHGLEMLLYQGITQFELYTGRPAPIEVMRKILMNYAK